ncbi:hypothetical protein Cni_G16591 [Canna indica]|uniref:Epidermal patterning factor-like protein n=1 Tax=Canna indica TaxID=4628 RepID=A0AAQ3KFM3_9LILI|nr:hypothetical protein Cni_G16591 [Canna indica]
MKTQSQQASKQIGTSPPKLIHIRKMRARLLLFVLILLSSTQDNHSAQGRTLSRILITSNEGGEEKVMVRALIGSRPPRCERRCSKCGHCEAVQVPVIPQWEKKRGSKQLFFEMANLRGDYTSNYKPLSWKCKCGDVFFNP